MTETITAVRRRRGLLLASTAAMAVIALSLSVYGLRTWLTVRGVSSGPVLWAWTPLAVLLLAQTVLYLYERLHRADARGQGHLEGLHVAVLVLVFNEDNGYLRAKRPAGAGSWPGAPQREVKRRHPLHGEGPVRERPLTIGLYLSGQKVDMSDSTVSIAVELHGGPLDGLTASVTLTEEDPWVALPNDGCTFPGGRSIYAPDTNGRWVWQDDQPADPQ